MTGEKNNCVNVSLDPSIYYIAPSYFLIVGDDLACIAYEWCVEIENDINEEHNVHDGVNDQ